MFGKLIYQVYNILCQIKVADLLSKLEEKKRLALFNLNENRLNTFILMYISLLIILSMIF